VISEAQANAGVMLRDPHLSLASRQSLIERTLYDATGAISALLLPLPGDSPIQAAQPAQESGQAAPIAPSERLRVSAWVKTARGSALSYVCGWPNDLTAGLVDTVSYLADGDPASTVFKSGQYVNYPNLGKEQRAPSDKPELRGILIVPMYAAGRIIGVLQFEREKAERFDAPQAALARALAGLYSLALS
jgi:GAF domain-containing protein